MQRNLTRYTWHTGKLNRPVRLLVISDLHNDKYDDLLPLLPQADVLLLPGDMVNRYRQEYQNALSFLTEASQILPTFAGIGNHEMRMTRFPQFRTAVAKTDAKLLFNSYTRYQDLVIGCWYRPYNYKHTDMLLQMEKEPGAKILLCHRPEDYMRHLRKADVDLVLAGHAHGGQIRIGQQGLYAPGQGFFPKYTRGVIDGKMIVSAGASNPSYMPRIHNPCEVLLIELD